MKKLMLLIALSIFLASTSYAGNKYDKYNPYAWGAKGIDKAAKAV